MCIGLPHEQALQHIRWRVQRSTQRIVLAAWARGQVPSHEAAVHLRRLLAAKNRSQPRQKADRKSFRQFGQGQLTATST
jgi:hypothetical protein